MRVWGEEGLLAGLGLDARTDWLGECLFGRRVSGTGGECVVRCLTLIRSVPIFTVAMGGKVYFAWWITVECGSNGAALIVLCNVSGCGFRGIR